MTRERLGTEVTEASSDLLAGGIGSSVTPATDINEKSMAAWRERLAEHVDDPACLAGCQRLGRILGGAR